MAERSGLRVWPLDRHSMAMIGIGFLVALVAWSAAGLLWVHTLDRTVLGDADRAVVEWFERHRSDTVNGLSEWGSMVADTLVKVVAVAVVGAVMVIVWRRWHDALFLALAVAGEAGIFLLSSLVVGRDRPPVDQLDPIPPSGSFPSGHTAAAVAFYGGLFVIARAHTRRRAVLGPLLALAVLAPVIVGVSRLARGMHHPLDVVGGAVLGVVTILILLRAFDATDRRDDPAVPPNAQRFVLVPTDLQEQRPAPTTEGAVR